MINKKSDMLVLLFFLVHGVCSMDDPTRRKEFVKGLWGVGSYKVVIVPSVELIGKQSTNCSLAFDTTGDYVVQQYDCKSQVINVKTGETLLKPALKKVMLPPLPLGSSDNIEKTLAYQFSNNALYCKCWYNPYIKECSDFYYGSSGIALGHCLAFVSCNNTCELKSVIGLFDTELQRPFQLISMGVRLVGNGKSLIFNKDNTVLAVLLSDHTIAIISPHEPFRCSNAYEDVIVKCER